MDKEYIGSVLLAKGTLDDIVADIRGLLKLHTRYWWDSIEETPLSVDDFWQWHHNGYAYKLPSLLANLNRSAREEAFRQLKTAWGNRQLGITICAHRRNSWINDDWIKM